MPQLTGSVVKYPARASFTWYAALILIGTVILAQPICTAKGRPSISLLEAAFTATSASCVTGLAVRSTEHDFSFIGKLAILAMMQLGGVGIMTVTTFFSFRLGRRQGLRARIAISETLGGGQNGDLQWILSNVLRMTVLFEGLGFAILTLRNLRDLPPADAMWHALFHSISAFCNAGFGLYDDSLVRFQDDWIVNLTIATLIILGGIGFPVILDFKRVWKHPEWWMRWDRLLLHSKLMVLGTLGLLTTGTICVLVLEWEGVLREMPIWQKPMVAFFHSVSCRTAGFNSVNVAELSEAMLFISILLMAVGAGPCSTAGGFKVSTIMVLVCQAWSTFQGHQNLKAFRRTIPVRTIERATATAMLFTVIAAFALTALLVVEQSYGTLRSRQAPFLETMFEVVSALGTVGLSTGITPILSSPGKLILIGLMFLGRIGPISVFVALSRNEARDPLIYADEEPLIG
jgi:trk system potassium uptake protein